MHELALKMEKIVGRTDLVELIETPEVYKHEPRRRCPSVEKAKQELNYQPKIQLDDALNRIYNWAKNTY
jgi:UDP-glucuronate decarboxylase